MAFRFIQRSRNKEGNIPPSAQKGWLNGRFYRKKGVTMESQSRRQERVVFRSDHLVGKGFYHADRPSSLRGVGRDGKGPQGQVILLVSAKKVQTG